MADLSPYAGALSNIESGGKYSLLGPQTRTGARAYGRAIDPALLDAVRASSQRLGINPSDLLTAMSYETGGRLDHNLWGGKNNNYLGLIQFGPQEQAKYGVKLGMPVADHVTAAENFLRDRGVRPGMGLLDIYSTINAGAPGLYNRSDAANGGAPGTVADKVANQMAGHRARADVLLGEPPRPPMPIPNVGPSIANAYGSQPAPQLPLFSPPKSTYPTENMDAAHAALNLTPQEKSLYQRHLANLYGPGGVNNPNGSRSTLFQLSFDDNGKTYNVPTVYNGKILSPDDAIQRARTQGLQNFPSYGSQQEAEARYQQMHNFMDKDTTSYFQQRDMQPPTAGQTPSAPQSIWNFMFPQTAQSTTNLPLFTQDRQASDAVDWAAQLLRG